MSTAAGPALRILLVEDEPANRALIRAILARSTDSRLSRAQVDEAATIAEARAVLAGREFDVALLDVRLPDGSGLDLATDLKSGRNESARTIIISASVLPAERTRALESGADAFLGKPFGVHDLIDAILDAAASRA